MWWYGRGNSGGSWLPKRKKPLCGTEGEIVEAHGRLPSPAINDIDTTPWRRSVYRFERNQRHCRNNKIKTIFSSMRFHFFFWYFVQSFTFLGHGRTIDSPQIKYNLICGIFLDSELYFICVEFIVLVDISNFEFFW